MDAENAGHEDEEASVLALLYTNDHASVCQFNIATTIDAVLEVAMHKWLYQLRWEHDLVFWEIFTAAGQLICRSLNGFPNEFEAMMNLRDYHPANHF